jgi:hypothetical protein
MHIALIIEGYLAALRGEEGSQTLTMLDRADAVYMVKSGKEATLAIRRDVLLQDSPGFVFKE